MEPKLSRILGEQKVLQLKNCCIALIESASWPMLQARASTRLRPSACTFAISAFRSEDLGRAEGAAVEELLHRAHRIGVLADVAGPRIDPVETQRLHFCDQRLPI